MQEYIYKDNGRYYRELTDLIGITVFKEEITEQEYYSYKGNDIKNIDILEDLYLQYEDLGIALTRYLELFNLKIVSKNT